MKVLQGCHHERIVSYVDRVVQYDKDALHFYLVMEYMSKVEHCGISGDNTMLGVNTAI